MLTIYLFFRYGSRFFQNLIVVAFTVEYDKNRLNKSDYSMKKLTIYQQFQIVILHPDEDNDNLQVAETIP